VRTGIGVEKRWPLFGALAVVMWWIVMPLARWAKAVMTVQAVASLAILGLVIARAVNILQ
jgi:hypothetical protein